MKKLYFCLGLLLLTAQGLQAQELKQEAKIEIAGVRVEKKMTDAQKEMFFTGFPGTRLMLYFSLPGKNFIGADREACKFEKFTDDKGTDLYAPLGHAPEADDWLGSFGPKFSEGKLCGLSVEAPGLPHKEAAKLMFAASLVLQCGSASKTVAQKGLALKKGSKITIGPVPLEIVSAAGDAKTLTLKIKARKSLERITKIGFADATGKDIPTRFDGYESGSTFGFYETTETHILSRKVPVATVKITYFDKVEFVTVPIKVETGLGIGS